MSHSDVISEKLLKKYSRSWFPHQVKLIYMISKYPVIYIPLPTKQRRKRTVKVKFDDAWTEVSSKLGQPILGCKLLWRNTISRYAKIMSLINTGRITKKAAMTHPETARFFDGRLSFMDPYLCEIGDDKIPFAVHEKINKIFHIKTKQTLKTSNSNPDNQAKKLIITHAQVKALLKKRELKEKQYSDTMDTKSLQTVIDTAVKSKLEELLKINLSRSSNDIVNNDDENAVNVQSNSDVILIPSDEENTSECITKRNLGLQSELINKANIEIDHEDDQIMEDDEQSIEDDEQRIEDDEQRIRACGTGFQSHHNTSFSRDLPWDRNRLSHTLQRIEYDEHLVKDNEQRMENDEQRIEDDVDIIDISDEDFKVNREDDVDNIQMNVKDFNINRVNEDGVREENLVIGKNLNNETLKQFDLEKMPIIIPGAYTISGNINDDISDAHIRNFFTELGEVMSVELNISNQNILKSRINELLKSVLRN